LRRLGTVHILRGPVQSASIDPTPGPTPALSPDPAPDRFAEVVLPAPDLAATLAYFVDELGFRLVSLTGADDPEVAVVAGHGVRLRLDRHADHQPGRLRVPGSDHRMLTAPNGTLVELVPDPGPLHVPEVRATPQISHLDETSGWHTGRAGMQYRDLVPDRVGGHLIASHIRILDGGEVPDYVHHHRIRFQMIYCARGWVEVVYEDQGPSFVLEAGDCVLQPPHIRHRVLRCSPGMEVFEVAAPATHDTFPDHEMTLPTAQVHPDRDFGGQRFVRHVAATAVWQTSADGSWEQRDTGIGAATNDLARVHVLRPAPGQAAAVLPGDERLGVAVVTEGEATVTLGDGVDISVGRGSCVLVPAGHRATWTDRNSDFQVLQIALRP
jgi:quercetin dioxygenase-like cupin family protein